MTYSVRDWMSMRGQTVLRPLPPATTSPVTGAFEEVAARLRAEVPDLYERALALRADHHHRVPNVNERARLLRSLARAKECRWCGDPFLPGNEYSFYCCAECRIEYHRWQRLRDHGTECAWCGDRFLGVAGKVYCKRACRDEHTRFRRGRALAKASDLTKPPNDAWEAALRRAKS